MRVADAALERATDQRMSDKGGPLSLLRSMWRSPLTRNGYSLIASAGLTSGLGLVFWVVAAHFYSAEQIGVSAALISALLTLGNVSQLNLGNMLNRYLPLVGDQAGQLIVTSYLVTTGLAALTSTAFLFGIGDFVKDFGFLRSSGWVMATFVVSAMFWTIFAMQDSVLVGLRRSTVVTLENGIYAVAKLLLLPVLAILLPALGTGVFVAWTLPLPMIVVAVNLIIFLKLLPLHRGSITRQQTVSYHSLAKFLGWDYIGTLAMMTATGAAPFLVLRYGGTEAIATYHLSWTICYPLYLISRSMSMSLLTEAAPDSSRVRQLAISAVVHSILPLMLGVVFIFLFAPWIMLLFGSAYVETGVPLLRVLVISTVPWSFVTIYLSMMRARSQMLSLATIQVATMIVLLGLGALLLKSIGIVGIGYAWLAAHLTVTAGIVLVRMQREGTDWLINGLGQVASGLVRLYASIWTRKTVRPLEADERQALTGLATTARLGSSGWDSAVEITTLSDVRTLVLLDAAAAAMKDGKMRASEAVLRISQSEAGMRALESSKAAHHLLAAQISGCETGVSYPEVLASVQQGDRLWVLERLLPGQEGRDALIEQPKRVSGLMDAVSIIDRLHRHTAKPTEIDEAWLARWVDGPLERIGNRLAVFMRDPRKSRSIARLRDDQHRFWRGVTVPLGLGHGDYYVGNLLFEGPAAAGGASRRAEAPRSCSVSAILDWEGLSTDAPPGLDAVYLAITSQATFSEDNIGGVVADLIGHPVWRDEDLAYLSGATLAAETYAGWPLDRDTNRALVCLAWLRHIDCNLQKSERYFTNRLWIESNVGQVLRAYDRFSR
ncbi:phosphotransferase [Aestuariivirga sp.]|uniref:phosphotransferase n=1 Tax=Aestuariivirga sp. TaxID=2650926 RepID=UPI0035AFE2BE